MVVTGLVDAHKSRRVYCVKTRLRKADYSRPVVVLRANSTEARICCFSTKFELLGSEDLSFDERDPDFKKTGLTESCYLILDSEMAVPLDFFDKAKLIGHVSGEIKMKVEDWWGEPL